MNLQIELTKEEENFLSEFSNKQYHGAEDNRSTADAIHTVEQRRERFVAYHKDLTDYYLELPLKFCSDDGFDVWYDSIEEVVEDYLLEQDIRNVGVYSYDDVYGKTIIGICGEPYFISNYHDYCSAYGVVLTGISWIEYYYQPVAFFFILDEAKKYIKYQKHNLKSPRIYTHHLGYSNRGELPIFRDLLLKMGSKINEENET